LTGSGASCPGAAAAIPPKVARPATLNEGDTINLDIRVRIAVEPVWTSTMTLTLAAPALPILVVDDSPFMRQTIRQILSSCGLIDVITAADGAEALERCREIEPAIILLDWTMPMLDGAEFLRLLRTDCEAPGRNANVIVVTSCPTPSLISEAQRWRVDAVVRKPFSPRTLMQRFEFSLRAWRATRPEWTIPAMGTKTLGTQTR
jgi:two-component system chemotaxis response regulator CheY